MLVNKKYKANDVIAIKLVTEEIIGRLSKDWDGEGNPTITKPLVLVPSMTQQGNPTLQLAPFMSANNMDDHLDIQSQQIITHTHCREDLAKQYIKMTSNVELASAADTSALKL